MHKLLISAVAGLALIGVGAGVAVPTAEAFAPRRQYFCYSWQPPGTCEVIPAPTPPTGPTTGTK